MSVRRLSNVAAKAAKEKKGKVLKDFKDSISASSNVAQLKKVVSELADYVFSEDVTK